MELIGAAKKLNDMVEFGAAYGYNSTEYDSDGSTAHATTPGQGLGVAGAAGNRLSKNDSSNYYLQAVITMAPGVFLVPEIGRLDYKTAFDGTDEGDKTYLGAKFQVNF